MDYQKPSIFDYGTLQELTEGLENGSALDHSYPTSTPKSDLTFS